MAANGATEAIPNASDGQTTATQDVPQASQPTATAPPAVLIKTEVQPMFIPSSSMGEYSNSEVLDLDDLFHDCYFGDFPYGSIAQPATSSSIPPHTTAIPPPPPPPPPPPVPVPAPTTTATAATYAPLVPNQSLKRKAEEAPPTLGSRPPPNNPINTTTSNDNGVNTALPPNNPTYIPDAAHSSASYYSTTAPVTTTSTTGTKQLTEQQKVERRERNREHAKRSRLRKKFLLESLQEQINGLNSEIDMLKDIIKKELPEKADQLLSTVSAPKGKFTPLPMPSGFGPVKTLMEPDFRLMSALSGSQQNFAISDPTLPDNPIVYVSQGFLDLTGYTLDQVLGRNCRFLQGPGTDQSAVDVIRKGIREGVDTSVCLLNYKADGTPFWNQFFVAALRDAENNVVNFVGVQCEVSKAVVDKQMAEKGYGISEEKP